jgi:hypothetical protein
MKKTRQARIQDIKYQAAIANRPTMQVVAHDNGDYVVTLAPVSNPYPGGEAAFLNQCTTGLDWYWVGKSLRVHVIGTPNNVSRDNVRA